MPRLSQKRVCGKLNHLEQDWVVTGQGSTQAVAGGTQQPSGSRLCSKAQAPLDPGQGPIPVALFPQQKPLTPVHSPGTVTWPTVSSMLGCPCPASASRPYAGRRSCMLLVSAAVVKSLRHRSADLAEASVALCDRRDMCPGALLELGPWGPSFPCPTAAQTPSGGPVEAASPLSGALHLTWRCTSQRRQMASQKPHSMLDEDTGARTHSHTADFLFQAFNVMYTHTHPSTSLIYVKASKGCLGKYSCAYILKCFKQFVIETNLCWCLI